MSVTDRTEPVITGPITTAPAATALATESFATGIAGHSIDPAILGIMETLTPLHPRGLGRTNITIIAPTIVQTDTPVPFAGFELVAGHRAGAVAMHVEPAAYGRTPGEHHEVAFEIETDGPCTFAWQAGFNTDQHTGSATVVGHGVIAMPLGTYSGGAIGLANIQQTSGTTWRWKRIVVNRPIVLQNHL